MASIVKKQVLHWLGAHCSLSLHSKLAPFVGPAAIQLGTLAFNNPVASIAATVATVTTTALIRNQLSQSTDKNEAVLRMSAGASKRVVKARSSAILAAHPIQHATVTNRTSEENNAVRWKQILRQVVGLIQLAGVVLPWFFVPQLGELQGWCFFVSLLLH